MNHSPLGEYKGGGAAPLSLLAASTACVLCYSLLSGLSPAVLNAALLKHHVTCWLVFLRLCCFPGRPTEESCMFPFYLPLCSAFVLNGTLVKDGNFSVNSSFDIVKGLFGLLFCQAISLK